MRCGSWKLYNYFTTTNFISKTRMFCNLYENWRNPSLWWYAISFIGSWQIFRPSTIKIRFELNILNIAHIDVQFFRYNFIIFPKSNYRDLVYSKKFAWLHRNECSPCSNMMQDCAIVKLSNCQIVKLSNPPWRRNSTKSDCHPRRQIQSHYIRDDTNEERHHGARVAWFL